MTKRRDKTIAKRRMSRTKRRTTRKRRIRHGNME